MKTDKGERERKERKREVVRVKERETAKENEMVRERKTAMALYPAVLEYMKYTQRKQMFE